MNPALPDADSSLPSWLSAMDLDDALPAASLPLEDLPNYSGWTPPSESAGTSTIDLTQTPLSLHAQPAKRPAEEPSKRIVTNGVKSVDVRGTLNERGDTIRFALVIPREAARGWESCRITTRRFPGIRKLRCSELPKVELNDLVWTRESIRHGESVFISVSIPRQADTEHLIDTVWPFTVTSNPMPSADVTVAWQVPQIVPLGESASLTVTMSNSHRAPADRVRAKAIRMSGSLAEFETSFVTLAAGQETTCTLPLAIVDQPREEYRVWLEVDGRILPAETLVIQGVPASATLRIETPEHCDLDQEIEVQLSVTNTGVTTIRDGVVQVTVTDEFQTLEPLVDVSIDPIASGETYSRTLRLRGMMPGTGRIEMQITGRGGFTATESVDVACRIASQSENILDGLLTLFRTNEERAEREQFFDESTITERQTGDRHILFSIASMAFSVPLSVVREVMREPVCTPVPGTDEWIVGMTHVRGEIATVVDLPRYLDFGSSPRTRRAVLMCSSANGPVGFLVDEVAGIRRFSPRALDREIRESDQKVSQFLTGIVEHGQSVVPVLDLVRLMSAMESDLAHAMPA